MLENITVAVTQRTNKLDMSVAGLFAAAFQGPKHGQTIALSLIRGYGTGRDHIDLLRRWSFSEKVVLH